MEAARHLFYFSGRNRTRVSFVEVRTEWAKNRQAAFLSVAKKSCALIEALSCGLARKASRAARTPQKYIPIAGLGLSGRLLNARWRLARTASFWSAIGPFDRLPGLRARLGVGSIPHYIGSRRATNFE
jgi:hypothetical protein